MSLMCPGGKLQPELDALYVAAERNDVAGYQVVYAKARSGLSSRPDTEDGIAGNTCGNNLGLEHFPRLSPIGSPP